MTKKIQFRPEGFHTVNPYLAVNGAAQVLDFLIKAFGAVEVGERFKGPDGASLVRGYSRIVPPGLRIGSLRSQLAERKAYQ